MLCWQYEKREEGKEGGKKKEGRGSANHLGVG